MALPHAIPNPNESGTLGKALISTLYSKIQWRNWLQYSSWTLSASPLNRGFSCDSVPSSDLWEWSGIDITYPSVPLYVIVTMSGVLGTS